MKRFMLWGILALGLGCTVALVVPASPPAQQTADPTESNVRTFYQGFERFTKHPHLVDQRIATLCTSRPEPEAKDADARISGPHSRLPIHIYMNRLAAVSRRLHEPQFPVGSIIVKEKLDPRDNSVGAIGAMIKRAPGFDPKNGDWEYAYDSKLAGFYMGKISSCASCHAKASSTDYVYGYWDQSTVSPKP